MKFMMLLNSSAIGMSIKFANYEEVDTRIIYISEVNNNRSSRFLQYCLNVLGFYSGNIDGIPGKRTNIAVSQFLKVAGGTKMENSHVSLMILACDIQKANPVTARDAIQLARPMLDEFENFKSVSALIRNDSLSEAEIITRKMIDEFESVNVNSGPFYAEAVGNLGIIYYNRGLYSRAEPLIEASRKIYFDIISSRLSDTYGWEIVSGPFSNVTVALSKLLRSQGRNADAESHLIKAIEILERRRDQSVVPILKLKAELAAIYNSQKRKKASQDLFAEVEKGLENRDEEDLDVIKYGIKFFGNAVQIAGIPIGDALEDLSNKRKKYGEKHRLTLMSEIRVISIYISQKRFSEAEFLSRRVVAKMVNMYGEFHEMTRTGVILISAVLEEQGKYVEAEKQLERALYIARRLFGNSSPKTIEISNRLALNTRRQGRHWRAAEHWHRAFASLPEYYADDSASVQNDGQSEALVNIAEYFGSVSLSANLTSNEQARISFEGQGWWKYGTLDLAMRDLAGRLGARDDAQARTARRYQEVRNRRSELLESIANTFNENAEAVSLRASQSARLELTEKELESLTNEINTNFPALAELTLARSLKAEDAQLLLMPGEALIAYAAATADLQYVWMITKDRVEWRRIGAAKEVRRLVDNLRVSLDLMLPATNSNVNPRCAVASTVQGMEGRDFDACKANKLYELALGGFDLTGLNQLIIVPDGPLETIPFSMLVTGFHADGRPKWLIEDYAISMLPTTSSLRALRQIKARASDAAQKPYLGVAPVTFSNRDVTSPLRSALEDLPGTENEVRFLSGLLGGGTEGYVTGKAASENFIKTSALDRYRVLSFATHGLMSRQSQDLTGGKISEPALVLAPSEGEDGLLTASEAASLSLDADWVLLSGCNTAGGSGDNADGLSGLARAFFFAGARALLVSHWSIDDNAAMDVMVETMKRAAKDKTLGKAHALRQAMLTVMQRPGYNHPFFWAPFSLIGVEDHVVGTRAASELETPSGRKLTNAEQSQIKALLGVAKKTTESGDLDGAASDYASSRKAKDAKSGRPIKVEPTESEADKPATSTEKAQACCSFDLTSLKQKLAGCWSIPPSGSGQRKAIFVYVALSRSGELVAEPRVDSYLMTGPNRILAQSVIRAVKKCAPYSLPEAHYDEWKNMRINFETQALQ